MHNCIILIGFMGAGKTCVGRRLQQMLSLPLIDTDEWIEKKEQKTINEIFGENGEDYFRDLETETLRELIELQAPGGTGQLNQETGSPKPRTGTCDAIISVGGGLPVRKENRELLRKLGTVFYLEATEDTLIRRLRGDQTRPKLQGGSLEDRIRTLMEQREQLYIEAADVRISTDGKSVEESAEAVISHFRV